MFFVRLLLFIVICFALAACGDDAPEPAKSTPAAPAPKAAQTAKSDKKAPAAKSAGGVSVEILPENPISTDCLTAVVKGFPDRETIIWRVNGTNVSTDNRTQLCGENYRRDDIVTVVVGSKDQGAEASVTIVNSLPQVVDISSTPDEIFVGTDITVEPVAEDADEDDVSFTYQWVINGEVDANYTEATLPGNAFSKGDTLQVLIVPNDFYEDGPTYESYSTPVPNAAPSIVSEPPSSITSLDYRYQVEVSDPDDSQFTYRLDEGPEGMEIDPASGLIRWSLAGVEPGEYTIAIVVTDPEGAEGAQEYNLTLGAPE